MPYTPFHADWKDFPNTTTPITAAALEYIEAGIQAAGGVSSGVGYYNVSDFGAVGDGVTDDRAAIQATIDAAFAAGGGEVLFVGPNTYLFEIQNNQSVDWGENNPITETYNYGLRMRTGVSLTGIGNPTLLCPWNNNSAEHPIGAWLAHNWIIQGITFSGGFEGLTPAPSAVAFPDALEPVNFLYPRGCDNIIIRRNTFTGIYGDCMRLENGTGGGDPAYNTNFRVTENVFTIANGQMVNIVVAKRGVVANNVMYDSQAGAGGSTECIVTSESSSHVTISNNTIIGCGVLSTAGAEHVAITGNVTAPIPGGNAAITLSGKYNTAIGNVIDTDLFTATGCQGIQVQNSWATEIIANTIHLPDAGTVSGITVGEEGGGSSGIYGGNTVADNSIRAATAGSILRNGTFADIVSIQTGPILNVIRGNVCTAYGGTESIIVGGVGAIVEANQCLAGFHALSGTTRCRLIGNTFKSGLTEASAQFPVIYLQAGTGHEVLHNTIDSSGAGTGATPIVIANGGSSYFHGNRILVDSGTNVLDKQGGNTDADVFDSNVLVGTGVWNLAATDVWSPVAGGLTTISYSATMATDATKGPLFKIAATDTSAFTISNPTNAVAGMQITYDIKNSSGGSMGTVTWGNKFLLQASGVFSNPANGKRRTIMFYYDGTNWVETSRAATDI